MTMFSWMNSNTGEIHCIDAEISIFPPKAVSADQNALEQQLNNFHSWFTVMEHVLALSQG